MRGVILAGGLGTRLNPLTKVINKHLLPVYDKPMICYPIRSLVTAGITDILIITGGDYAGGFIKLLGNGEALKCSIRYSYQQGEGGIADALRLAEDFSRQEPFVTILGDNYYEDNLSPFIHNFLNQDGGARVLLKAASDGTKLRQFGVPEFDKDNHIIDISEKPVLPLSNFIVTGTYMFDYKVWWYLSKLQRSARGEYEVTDLLNQYAKTQYLRHDIITGHWGDLGTHESLLETANFIAKKKERKL